MPFVPNSFGGPAGQFDAEAEVYGKDILFDGKLRVAPNGDYVTVDGFENLRRAILRRLIVRPGEYRLRPDYGAGLPAYVKKRFTPSVRDELTKLVKAQVLADPRIVRVVEVTLTQTFVGDEPVITVFLRAESVAGRFEPRPFSIPREV